MKIKKILKNILITFSILALILIGSFVYYENSYETPFKSEIFTSIEQPDIKNSILKLKEAWECGEYYDNKNTIKELYKLYLYLKKNHKYESRLAILEEIVDLQLSEKFYEIKLSETKSIDIAQMVIKLIDLRQKLKEPTNDTEFNQLMSQKSLNHLRMKYKAELLLRQGFIYAAAKKYDKSDKIFSKIINTNVENDKLSAYSYLLSSYKKQKKQKEITLLLQQVESYIKNSNKKYLETKKICSLYILMSALYGLENQSGKSLIYANKANDLYNTANLDDPILYMWCLYSKGLSSFYIGRDEEAVNYIEKAINKRNQLFKDKNRFLEIDKALKDLKSFEKETRSGR